MVTNKTYTLTLSNNGMEYNLVSVYNYDTDKLYVNAYVSTSIPVGTYTLKATYTDDNGNPISLTLPTSIEVKAPSIAKIEKVSQNTAMQGTGDVVVNIELSEPVSSINELYLSGNTYIPGYNYSVNGKTITAHFSIGNSTPAGSYSLYIYCYADQDYKTISSLNAFTITENPNKPVFDAATPSVAFNGTSLDVTISTKNINLENKDLKLSFEQASSTIFSSNWYNYRVIDMNTAVFKINIPYNVTPGMYDINLNVDGYSILKPGAFEVAKNPNMPAIVSISRNEAFNGSFVDVTISTENYNLFDKSLTLSFEQDSNTVFNLWNNYTVIDSTSVKYRFDVPYGMQTGVYDLRLDARDYYNSYETYSMFKPSAFTVKENPLKPAVVSVTPVEAFNGTALEVTVTTENFRVNGKKFNLSFEQASNTVFESSSDRFSNDSSIVFNVGVPFKIEPGQYDMVLSTYDYYNYNTYTIAVPYTFTVKQNPRIPSLVDASPSVAYTGSSVDVTISTEN